MINLLPMDQQSFDRYITKLEVEFADELMNSGEFTEEEARKKTRQTISELLPKGLKTKDHYLFDVTVKDQSNSIGILYLAIQEENQSKTAFIYDIEIDESLRGKSLGTQVLRAAEDFAVDNGANEIGLHVFAKNTGAFRLYQKLGYQVRKELLGKDGNVVGRRMAKPLT